MPMMSSAAAMTARLPEMATARGAATAPGAVAWSIVIVAWLAGTVAWLIGVVGVVGWLTCIVGWPAGVAGWLTGMVPGPTGTIVPGASIPVNLDHAPCQPSEVLGHRSNCCERGAPAIQIS